MNKFVSDSMSKTNDPHFEIITPLCKVCRNSEENFRCKIYGTKPKEYGYGKQYDCPNLDLNKDALSYKEIKELIKDYKESKCENCFYYKITIQHDYIKEDINNNYCGIYENGIPNNIWNHEKICNDFKKVNIEWKKTRIPEKFKKEILRETNFLKIIELENKYSKNYLLDDDIINHELKYTTMSNWNENYYIRKEENGD